MHRGHKGKKIDFSQIFFSSLNLYHRDQQSMTCFTEEKKRLRINLIYRWIKLMVNISIVNKYNLGRSSMSLVKRNIYSGNTILKKNACLRNNNIKYQIIVPLTVEQQKEFDD